MKRLQTTERVIQEGRILSGIVVLLFLLGLIFGYQTVFASGTPALVETEWLANNLDRSELRIVYVGSMGKDDRAKFDNKHIPGSVYLSIGSLMGVLGNGSAPPDKAKFESLMSSLGIKRDDHVVVYGSSSANPFVTAAFWLMKYFGHEKVSYMNGGIKKWNKEGRKTTGEATKVSATTYKASAGDESIRATADYVLSNLKNPKVVIVDTRPADVYKGKKSEVQGHKREGHIPGAVNLNFYTTNLNSDGTFKSADDLKATYEAKGVTRDKEVITYCEGGVRASHSHFVLKYILGYPKVRDYVGSWGEWNKLDPNKYPIEK